MSAAGVNSWTSKQAYLMIVVCLVVGTVGGFIIRGSAAVAKAPAPSTRVAASTPKMAPPLEKIDPSPAEMKSASEHAAMPFLQRLQENPKDFKLLVQAGEMYYQHGSYERAAGYYESALKVEDNRAVRNQYASALLYKGDADAALREYARVLQSEPTNDIALFNSGLVKFKSKHDATGAIELWTKLLQAQPNHPQRARIERMIERAKTSQ